MANKSAARKAKREAARKKKRQGSTSTASRGLVLNIITDDPECAWLADFVQLLGEKFFEAGQFNQLSRKQRGGCIKFNERMARIGKSVARQEGDFNGFLRFLERIGEDEEGTDLGEAEAKIEAYEGTHAAEEGLDQKEGLADPEERRREERHQAELSAWKTWQDNQRRLVWVIVFAVLFAAATITFGAIAGKAVFIGIGVAGAMAVGLIKALFSGATNPFSTPWRSGPPSEEESAPREP